MTALKHLVLDVSVIIDLWLRPERAQAIEGLFAAPGDAGVCRWVSATSLPTLEFIAVRRFKEQGVDAERARTLVRRLMTDLLSRVKVLSNRGYDQDDLYARARDFEDAQIAASARCLTAGQGCIVSSDANFDALDEILVRTPEQALEWLADGEQSSLRSCLSSTLQPSRSRYGPRSNVTSKPCCATTSTSWGRKSRNWRENSPPILAPSIALPWPAAPRRCSSA